MPFPRTVSEPEPRKSRAPLALGGRQLDELPEHRSPAPSREDNHSDDNLLLQGREGLARFRRQLARLLPKVKQSAV